MPTLLLAITPKMTEESYLKCNSVRPLDPQTLLPHRHHITQKCPFGVDDLVPQAPLAFHQGQRPRDPEAVPLKPIHYASMEIYTMFYDLEKVRLSPGNYYPRSYT